ncbi:MAG: cadherin-like beta sandwich domain-containing protein [Clostridia bacterium]
MDKFIKHFRWIMALAFIASVLQMTTQQAEAGSYKPLSTASTGEYISFGGKEWMVLDPSTGYILARYLEPSRAFDPDNTNTFAPGDPNNIAYWLNNDFYNSLANNEWIESKNWTTGREHEESSSSVSAKVGLISKSEYETYKSVFSGGNFWTRTPDMLNNFIMYIGNNSYAGANYNGWSPRPALYLKPGLYLTPSGQVTDVPPYTISSQLMSPANNQVFSEVAGQNTLAISGTTKADAGITITVKYTIDGIPAHTNQTIQILVTDGTDQNFSKNITVDHTLAAGSYTLRVWNEDHVGEKSAETTRTIVVVSTDLNALSLSSGTLNPGFSKETINYTASVANNVTSVTVTPTVVDATATVKVNGASVASGQASSAINLAVGSNPPIMVRVTAQDGTSKDYTITVHRKSGNADLSTLTVDGTSVAGFAPTTTAYTVNVPNTTTAVTVVGTAANPNASVNVTGGGSLSVGDNTVTVRVTAEDPMFTKNYTITVHRKSGNADLSTLAVDGTSVAGFAPNTVAYTVNVPNATTAVTVVGTAANPNASVNVTGGGSLSVGDNTVTVRVTAEDPSITKTYTITVHRKSGNADLSTLAVDGASVAGFAPTTVAYTVNVPNATTAVTVTGTAADSNASVNVTGGGSLNVGDNTVTVRVTAEDPSITKTYTITVHRKSGNADLSTLTVDGASVAGFAPNTVAYTVNVPNATTAVTVTGTAADSNASVNVTGGGSLNVGDNTVTVRVTAEDSTITRDYTITVRRQADNAELSALTVDGTSVAGFAPGTLSYTMNVPYATTAVAVTGTAADTNASVSVTGGSSLNVGDNTVTVRVTAEDTAFTKDYTITVRRQADNADLRALEVDGVPVAGFAPETTAFTVNVPNATTAVTVMGTVADANASMEVDGVSVDSGQASNPIHLKVGDNSVTVRVTAEDPSITKNYTIIVNRAASSNAELSGLSLSSGTLSPAFNAGVTTYTVKVGYKVTTMTVTPTVADPTATVEVDNKRVPSGQASDAFSLKVGSRNHITITVTAEDGSMQQYTIQVTRQSPPSSYYPVTNVSLDPTKLTLTAGGETAVLHATVTPTYATDPSVSWSSGNPEVASVDRNGVVTPHKEGEVIITVTTQDGNFTAQSLVKVEPEPEPAITLVSLKVSKESVLLKPGKQTSFRVYAVYSDGKEEDITSDKKTSFKSSSRSSATVTPGIIKAGKKEGEAMITVRYENQRLEIPVTISKRGVKELQLSLKQVQLETGEEIQLQAMVMFSDSTQRDVTDKAVWVSTNPERITIQKGKLTAHSAGETTVIAHYAGKTAALSVQVTEPKEVKRISTGKRTMTLKAGNTQRISLTAYYKDGTKAVVTGAADWSSADESVAVVEAGAITAVDTGTTTVTVKYRDQVLAIRVTVMEP